MATAPKAAPKPGSADVTALHPAGKSKKLIFIILGVVLLLAGGIGGAWFYFSKVAAPHGASDSKSAGAAAVHDTKPPVFMSLEAFTVNLQVEEMQQFLQVTMTLQVADAAQEELIKTHLPQVRSRLLLLLSSKKSSEILTVEGKKKLAAEVLEQLKEPFSKHGPSPEVTDVFFTSFVVQ